MLRIPNDLLYRSYYLKNKVRLSRLKIAMAHWLTELGLKEILKKPRPKGLGALHKEIKRLGHYIVLLKESERYYRYLQSIHKHTDYGCHLKKSNRCRSK